MRNQLASFVREIDLWLLTVFSTTFIDRFGFLDVFSSTALSSGLLGNFICSHPDYERSYTSPNRRIDQRNGPINNVEKFVRVPPLSIPGGRPSGTCVPGEPRAPAQMLPLDEERAPVFIFTAGARGRTVAKLILLGGCPALMPPLLSPNCPRYVTVRRTISPLTGR